jgi:RNA polymerase sigma factor (sigma-70 family)
MPFESREATPAAVSARPMSDDDLAALITSHDHLATFYAHRYLRRAHGDLTYEDLVQEARLALVVAAKRFDPSRGLRFTTYASAVISGALRHVIRDKGFLIRRPRWAASGRRAYPTTEPLTDVLMETRFIDPESVEERVVSADTVARLLAALDRPTRRIVDACWIRDVPQATVAASLGTTQRAISHRLARARHRLQEVGL